MVKLNAVKMVPVYCQRVYLMGRYDGLPRNICTIEKSSKGELDKAVMAARYAGWKMSSEYVVNNRNS